MGIEMKITWTKEKEDKRFAVLTAIAAEEYTHDDVMYILNELSNAEERMLYLEAVIKQWENTVPLPAAGEI